MRLHCTRWGLAIAAGLVWLLPATAARAQYSYGYDSFVTLPPAQSFWYSSGYEAVYTDPSTGAYHNGQVVPNRTVAPYADPPYGQFRVGNGLPVVAARTTIATPATVRQPVVKSKKRGLLGRRR